MSLILYLAFVAVALAGPAESGRWLLAQRDHACGRRALGPRGARGPAGSGATGAPGATAAAPAQPPGAARVAVRAGGGQHLAVTRALLSVTFCLLMAAFLNTYARAEF